MVSLLIESFGNNIKTKGSLADNSKIKILLQTFADEKTDILNRLHSLKCNLNFSEVGSDLLTKLSYSKGSLSSLKKRGYKETTIDNYNFENLNHILKYEYKEYVYKKFEPFINTINLNGKDSPKTYMFFHQENFILFVPTISNSSVEYYYKLNGYKILDFKIDENLFVYILVEKNDKQFLAITHLGKGFSKYNSDDSTLNINECYNFINLESLPKKVSCLEYIENNNFYFVDIDNQILNVTLCKKYFFIDGNYIYFNNQGDCDEFSDLFLDVVQNNFLNMYNYLNFLGLNDFKVSGRKLSTKENNIFLEVFKNKFDNTLNGGLNYFNAKKIDSPNISEEITKSYNDDKDYHINIDDEYYSIKGNFVYKNYEKGDFKIEVTKESVSLYQFKNDVLTLVYKVFPPSYKNFIFCNLKFTFKKFEFPLKPYSFYISSKSPYLFKQSIAKNVKLYSVPNNSKTINNFINLSNDSYIDSNVDFDGRKIIFHNYFDWKNKTYKYGNLTKKLLINDTVDISKIKQYVFFNSHVIKENKLYSRESGTLYYTNSEDFKFELINSKGYVTPFWINNQDKVVYFKNNKNSVSIIDNKHESDFYAYIPKIENYIRYNNNMYLNVYVSVNDNLEVQIKNTDNVLITNKMFNEPLFYKTYIEENNIRDIHLFNNEDNEISECVYEKFNNGYIVYFNIEKNKKYYYNTKNSKYNYFEPIESYKNIDFSYRFDDSGYINLDYMKEFKTLTLKCDKLIDKEVKCSLFLYNTENGSINKIDINKNEIGNKFEIDINVNKIYLELDNNSYEKNLFYIVDDSNESLYIGDSIVFFKNDRKDVVYVAEKNIDINIEKIDFSLLKTNINYKIDDYNNIIETTDGSFIIDSLNSGELAIISNDKENDYISVNMFITESLGDGNDEFYRNNFKMPGNMYINHDINSEKIAETINTNVSTDEIFITSNGGPNE